MLVAAANNSEIKSDGIFVDAAVVMLIISFVFDIVLCKRVFLEILRELLKDMVKICLKSKTKC